MRFSTTSRVALVGFLVLFLPFNSDVGVAGHRTQWRGLNQQQESAGKGVFETDGFGLEIVWTKSLGSGHSRITVVEGRAITMFSDGEFDNLVALEVATGEEIWRYRIATTYRGHDGSADGPHSTPIVDGGVVYGLGPKGHLFAVSFVDGAEIWSRKIDEELGARAPYWGFATTPATEGQMLIVQTGGPEGRAITGFDKRTGEVRWTVGGDTVGYQSPTMLTLAGVRQVVAVGNQEIMGILPRTGEVLWTYRYSTRDTEGSSRPLPLGKDKFLLRFMREGEGPGDAALYRVEGTDEEGFTVTEIWRSTAFKGSFSAPVFYGGHLYGYNGSFLTCVDAATGKEVWKSRPPGGRTLGLADDHLLILAPRGVVVAVEATPAGYKEKARVRALDRRSFASPTFVDGHILVRDFTHIVSVRVTEPAAVSSPTAAEPEPALADSEFAAFVRQVEVARDKEVLIDEFMGNQDQFPIVEGDHRVHFVYRGEEQRVGVKGNMLDDFGFPDPMHRIDGTDFHHRSYALEPGSRWEYQFVLNMDEMNEEHVTDPFNPRVSYNLRGEVSELAMPGWVRPAHLDEPTGERGRIESFTFRSGTLVSSRGIPLEQEREIKVYLPPAYDEGEERYPLLVVNNGIQALQYGKMDRSLDNLIGTSVAPVIVAFVPPLQMYREYGGRFTDEYATLLVDEIVPDLENRYRTVRDRDSRAIMGAHIGALAAVYTALHHPRVFGKVALQSLNPWAKEEEVLLLARSLDRPMQFYVSWNRYEYRSPESGLNPRRDSRVLVDLLRERGYSVAGGEFADGGGWGSWAVHTDGILQALFPLRPRN